MRGSKTEKKSPGGICRRITGTNAVQFLCERCKKGRVRTDIRNLFRDL